MAKVKVSEWSATPGSNTDIDGINIAEGCAPSGINDAIREMMSQIKDWQSGASGDSLTIGAAGSLTLSGGTANGVAYLNGSKVLTTGSALTFDGTNLGIGTSSPGAKLDVATDSGTHLLLSRSTPTQSPTYIKTNADFSNLTLQAGSTAGYFSAVEVMGWNGSGSTPRLAFYTAGSERALIDSSGNWLVGKTSTALSSNGLTVQPNGEVYSCVVNTSNSMHVFSTTVSAYRFYVTGTGTINATNTSITAISDQSLKENVRDLETGLSQVMALRPRRFDWKEDTGIGEKNVAGFIAQELEQVLPELVYEYQYKNDEVKKSIKMGDILPTLVKAIQEQQAIIQSMEARLAALEAK